MSDLSIIIPVYNAAPLVEASLTQIVSFFEARKISFEIVLCDDGSADSSFEAVQLFSWKSDIRIYRNEVNRGLGFTLRRLIWLARSERLIYCDIDLPFGAQGLCDVWDQMQDADIVVASRYSGQKAHVPLRRRICSRFYWLAARILTGIPVRDIGSGTVGFRRSDMKDLDLRSDGFDIHLELYLRALKQGLKIKEIGLPSRKTAGGSFLIRRHGFEALKSLWRWRGMVKRQERDQ